MPTTIQSNLPQLFETWQKRIRSIWKREPERYLHFGKEALKAGEPLLAYDIFTEGLGTFREAEHTISCAMPLYVHLSQQQALALAESGALTEASTILRGLLSTGTSDGETRGLLGRTSKELALNSTNPEEREAHLAQAFEIYHTAYLQAKQENELETAYYNGINAATLALFSGNNAQSTKLAKEVFEICYTIMGPPDQISYWLAATMGEAALLCNDIQTSSAYYTRAVSLAGDDLRGRLSMQRQAGLILTHLGYEERLLTDLFKIPSVVVFSGHMIDQDGGKKRFPPQKEEFVRGQIREHLKSINAGIAYSSAACGADIIFLEEMIARNGEINIVLPFDIERFKLESITFLKTGNWEERFDKLLSQAAKVTILTQFNSNVMDLTFDFTNRFIYGAASNRAKMIGTKLQHLAVWDGTENHNIGGTCSAISLWHAPEESFKAIHPLKNETIKYKLRRLKKSKHVTTVKFTNQELLMTGYSYLPLLFADIKHYSSMNDPQIINFVSSFMKDVGAICRTHRSGILSRHTAGDGLFIVFADLEAATQFAIELSALMSSHDWASRGLPADLDIRISLDAGPCYSFRDPVTGDKDFCGSSVIRAARMEPITPPGHIYASDTFVALSRAQRLETADFKYAGQVILPKDYGVIPAYHLCPRK